MKSNAVAWAALVVSAAALAGSRISTKPATAVQEIPAEGQKVARALSDAFNAVADFARPSVVQIAVLKKASPMRFRGNPGGQGQADPRNLDPKQLEEMMKRFLEQNPEFRIEKNQLGGGVSEGTGSGFVYDGNGHILTNNHVVEGADRIVVTFHDGETAEAKIVGTDPDADVAVIKVEGLNYRALPKGKSEKLRIGEWVIAVGSPFGLDQTVTAGIVSATERGNLGIIGRQGSYEGFIQTDAAINPGNSGGPLIDMDGRVIGINSAIATSSHSNAGVGFAIPIDMASILADKLIKDGKVSRARVGFALKQQPLTPSQAKKLGLDPKTHGIIVEEVLEGSPGEKAGVKTGDVIAEWDSHIVDSVAEFRNLVSASDYGKSYNLKYFRDGKEQVAQVIPAPEETVVFARERNFLKSRAAAAKLDEFGLSVLKASPAIVDRLGYPKDTEGLVITAVREDSPAAKAQLEEGDMIVKIVKDKKTQPITSVDELIAAAEGTDDLSLFILNIREPKDEALAVTLSKKPVENKDAPKN